MVRADTMNGLLSEAVFLMLSGGYTNNKNQQLNVQRANTYKPKQAATHT